MSKAALVAGTFQPTTAFPSLDFHCRRSSLLASTGDNPAGVLSKRLTTARVLHERITVRWDIRQANVDNRIAVWALTNTSSLDTATPSCS